MGRPWAGQPLALALLAMLLLASVPNALALRTDGLEEATTVTVQARNTVLVEEMTATWCTTCADIDPYLAEVADRHGSRLALVGLHPMDGIDGVATEASEVRLERWRAVHNNLNQTPAFLVEGETPLVGPEIWPEVTRRMLELESSRSARANMSLSATRDADAVLLDIGAAQPLEGRQVTLMLLQHGRSSASYGVEAEPGSTYDRVLVELHTMTTNGSWNSICDGMQPTFTTSTPPPWPAEGDPSASSSSTRRRMRTFRLEHTQCWCSGIGRPPSRSPGPTTGGVGRACWLVVWPCSLAQAIVGFRKKDFRRRMIPPGMALLLPDSVKILRQMTKPLYPAEPM